MDSKTTNKGFTIIEVVLVLAIAGLIFLMVFLALPALQRSQRDSQRKSDVSRLMAALNDYKAANRSKLPADDKWDDFVQEYLIGDGDRGAFIDPSGGSKATDKTYELTAEANAAAKTGTFEEHKNKIYYTVGARCKEGGSEVVANQGQRVVAFRMKLENAGWHCLDN